MMVSNRGEPTPYEEQLPNPLKKRARKSQPPTKEGQQPQKARTSQPQLNFH